jgi:hypothetical protein
MVSCPKVEIHNRTESHCILYDEWLEENSYPVSSGQTDYSEPDQFKLSASGISIFQSIFGISRFR